MKTCSKCHELKPAAEFHKHRDGLNSSCKECVRIDQKVGVRSGWRGPSGALRLPKGVEF